MWKEPENTFKTMICLILDRSGSMSGKEEDVIGGVNKFLEDQKKLPSKASISMVRFDSWNGSQIETFKRMQPLSDVGPISIEDYQPRGMTPLLDAIGKTLKQLDADWVVEKPHKTICVIITDGLENDSKEYNKDQIKNMIEDRQKSDKWSFIYLGSDVNSFSEAGSLGINKQNTACYTHYSGATMAASDAVSYMRNTGSGCAPNLGGELDENGNLKK
jgi:uncharacterized protein YegL